MLCGGVESEEGVVGASKQRGKWVSADELK